MNLSNKMYDILKWVAQYLLPALGTLYFALAGIWGFPYGEEVVGTITAIDAFLGVLLSCLISQKFLIKKKLNHQRLGGEKQKLCLKVIKTGDRLL